MIAIDYGTTYTGAYLNRCSDCFRAADYDFIGLAWSSSQPGTRYRGTVNVLQDWTPSMSNQDKVRSMYAYTAPGEAQWGSDISDDAITFVNTKLELEPRETRLDELEATLHLVRGTKNLSFEHIRNAGPQPAFTANTPTQIITDYLTKIRECACREDNINVSKLVTTKTPVDIVITVPVVSCKSTLSARYACGRLIILLRVGRIRPKMRPSKLSEMLASTRPPFQRWRL